MGTIWRVARTELRDGWRDRRLPLAIVALGLLVLASGVLGWRDHRLRADAHADALRLERQVWTGQGEKNPHSAAHYGMFAFKRTSPLASFDPGTDPVTGTVILLEAHNRHRPAPPLDAPAPFPGTSPAGLLQVLVPLVLVVLGHGGFVGRRERGTLALVVSQGVSGPTLLAGQLVALLVPVALVVVPLFAVALLAGGASGAGGIDATRVLMLLVAYMACFIAVAALTLGVSSRARSARGALLLLLAWWFTVVVVAPRVALDVAAWRHPLPTPEQFRLGVARDLEALPTWDERVARVTARLLARHGVGRLEDLPVHPDGEVLLEAEADETRVHGDHHDRLATIEREHEAVQAWTAVVSPVVALQVVSAALAATDPAHHRRFMDDVEAHRYAYVQQLNTHLAERMPSTGGYEAGASLWETVPPPLATPPALWWSLGHVRGPAVALLAWVAVSLLFAYTSVRRITVA